MAQPAPAPLDQSNVITINADGTFTPPGGVTINPGGVVRFDVNYQQGTNTCTVTFGSITFSYDPGVDGGPTNTVKVG